MSYRAAHASGLGHSISLGEKRDASRDEANHILFEWLCNAIHCSGLSFIGILLFAVALGENIVVCRWVETMFLLFYAAVSQTAVCYLCSKDPKLRGAMVLMLEAQMS